MTLDEIERSGSSPRGQLGRLDGGYLCFEKKGFSFIDSGESFLCQVSKIVIDQKVPCHQLQRQYN
jgi:hypothetical protein